jgi:hypothetical protein
MRLVLGNAKVLVIFRDSFECEQVPATAAFQLIADIDGMRVAFNDKRVHFAPK